MNRRAVRSLSWACAVLLMFGCTSMEKGAPPAPTAAATAAAPAAAPADATSAAAQPAQAASAGPSAEEKAKAARAAEEARAKGEAALAAGDLVTAFDSFAAAGDAASLRRVADAAMSDRDYATYVKSVREAGMTVVFRDDFRTNARNWNLRDDDSITAQLIGGALAIRKHTEKDSSYLWTTAALDPGKDFRIETRVTKKSGAENRDISLVWGMKDINNTHEAGISPDGSVLCGTYKDGSWKELVPWTECAAVVKGNATNTLTVERAGGTIVFLVNGTEAARFPWGQPFGDRVGLCISPQSELSVEYFLVEELPAARGPWVAAADNALAASDLTSAVKYESLVADEGRIAQLVSRSLDAGQPALAVQALGALGFSERSAQVRIASIDAQAGRSAEAAAALKKAGWDLQAGFIFPLADEEFSDNSRQWSSRDDAKALLSVGAGGYTFENRRDSGYSSWNTFDIARDADFRVEVAVTKISGVDDESFSLNVGFTSTDTESDFGIYGSGSFEFGTFTDGKWKAIIPKTESPLVHKGNAANTLAMERHGGRLLLFVNGGKVGETDFPGVQGKNVGFALYGKMKVKIDSLRLVEWAPAFALDLAKSSLFTATPVEYSRRVAPLLLAQDRVDEALKEFLAAGDAANARLCYGRLARQAEDSGDLLAAVDLYQKAGDPAKSAALISGAAAQAAAAKNWKDALRLYGMAGDSEDALRGVVAADDALGLQRDADAARARLAAWYTSHARPQDASDVIAVMKDPALLAQAGERSFAAGDYAAAADMFHRAGSTAREKEAWRRLAERAVADGDYGAARELYGKAGNTAKVAEMDRRIKELSVLPTPGARSVYYDTSGSIISLALGAAGSVYSLTDAHALDRLTGQQKATPLITDVSTSGWAWPCVAVARDGSLWLMETDDSHISLLERVDAAGKRTTVFTSTDDILAMAADADGGLYYSTMRTDGSNLTLSMDPTHISAADFICGEIWRLDTAGQKTRIYEGGLPLAMTVDPDGKLYASIWGSKGSFSAEAGDYSLADPRLMMFICLGREVQVCRVARDGTVSTLCKALDAVSALLAPRAGLLLGYGFPEPKGDVGFYAIDTTGSGKVTPFLTGKDYFDATSSAASMSALYFGTTGGKLYKVPLR